jgi:hypothetical protein
MRRQTMMRCAVGMVAAGLLVVVAPVYAGSGATGDCNPPNVPVHVTIQVQNNTGQDANDFHLYMYQNDKPQVHVTGAQASCSSFGTVNVGLGTDNGQPPPPPPGDHGADVDMSGGTVPAGGVITVDLVLCMNERNCVKIKDIEWTKDGAPIGAGAVGGGGFRVRRPRQGGDGGSHAPDGGGRGKQEGSGGTGNWIHEVSIENDGAVPLVLEELRLLASMTYYPNIQSINWASIAPIQNAAGEPPVCIYPGGAWTYDFNTTGSYVGGHIYLMYTLRPAVSGECGLPAPGTGVETDAGDDVLEFGDHPVDAVQTDILLGEDYWTTLDGSITFGSPDLPPIPADFFGPGSDPFEGQVALKGVKLSPELGDADTIIQRLEEPIMPEVPSSATIPIELVGLQLKSVEPIYIPPDSFFDVSVTFDPGFPPEGTMFVDRTYTDGGTFNMQVTLLPHITFQEVSGGPILEYPPSLVGPLTQQTGAPHPWSYIPPTFTIPGSGPNFFAPWDVPMSFGSASLQQTLVPAKPPAPGDFDLDGDVDLSDYGQFLDCYNGPGKPPAQPDCGSADFDMDGDVDLSDYGQFLDCYNGPSKPPACY